MNRRLLILLAGLLLLVGLTTPVGALPGDGTTVAGGNGAGAADNQLASPSSVTVDASGNLYVADLQNNRVQKVDTNGTVTTVAGGNGQGSTNNQLNNPADTAIDATGTLYVADNGNHRVQRVDTNGTTTTIAGGNGSGPANNQLHYPWGVSLDDQGNVYVVDLLNYRVQKVDTNGTVTTVAGGNGKGSAANQLHSPTDMTIDAAGNLYIADTGNHRIQMVTTNGTTSTVAGNNGRGPGANQLDDPHGVALDAAGNLYIADTGNHRIQMVTTNGTTSTVAGNNDRGPGANQLDDPHDVALDAAGTIYIADLLNNRIQRVEGPDFTDPTITIGSPSNNDTISNGANLTARFTCADNGGSGLNTCTATLNSTPINAGDPIPTIATGSNILEVAATDNSGNTATASVTFTIKPPPGPREITGEFRNATEMSGAIARLYMATFNRQPDSHGHAFWLSKTNNRSTLANIADFFATSPGFAAILEEPKDQDFVELVYLSVMNRTGETEGVSYWTTELRNGASRARVLLLFSESPEFKTLTKTS